MRNKVDKPKARDYNHSIQIVVSVAQDVAMVAGSAAVSYGAFEIYRPAGFIVFGALAIGFALLKGSK